MFYFIFARAITSKHNNNNTPSEDKETTIFNAHINSSYFND